MPARFSNARVLILGGILVAVTVLAWSNSFSGPFVFDDRPAILANPTLDRFTDALQPPRDGGTVTGRPVVNLSLALNRALSGTEVWSYHAFNLLVHLAAGLTLFGLARRTLERGACLAGVADGGENIASPPAPRSATPNSSDSDCRVSAAWIAFGAAALWLLHPLQTAAVTYVIQRAESLCGWFYFVTLYAFHRSAVCHLMDDKPHRRGAGVWAVVSVLACFLGMGTKEVMATAPVLVWLYDRTFFAGTFRAAVRQRGFYYAALAATWLPLAWLVYANAGRAGTAGFGSEISAVQYAFTQCAAVVHYLRLALWPDELVFDYGTTVIRSFGAVWPQATLLAALVGGTIFALRRWPRAGFVPAAAFLLLAPSSSVVPIATQTLAEHRMYLPLAALAVGVTVALRHALHRRAGYAVGLVAAALALLTFDRNRVYQSALALWTDTVARRPENPRAHNHLGIELARAGQLEAAAVHHERALQLVPDDAEAHNNLGSVLRQLGRAEEALRHFETSVERAPDSGAARLNLALALLDHGRPAEALPHFAAAEKLIALDAAALTSFGAALAAAGDLAGAIARYRGALEADATSPRAHYNLGVALARSQQLPEATRAFAEAARLDPQHVAAHVNHGNALLLLGRVPEAIAAYEAALAVSPNDAQARANLALARAQLRKTSR